MKFNFSIGADPELFLQDAAGGFISSIGKIGGSKKYPIPLLDLGKGFAVQEDNVALEYNIPPANSKQELVDSIAKITAYLSNGIKEMGLSFARDSAVFFPEKELEHPMAKEFGCDPDFNAWEKGAKNPRPVATNATLRSCGGHIHLGSNKYFTPDAKWGLIQHMDLFLGVPSTIQDTGELRKQLYGKAGAFRYKPYGVEYRVLSNYWTLDPKLIEWVWEATTLAMDAWQDKKIDINSERKAILDAINNNNKDQAKHLAKKYNLLFA